METAYLYVRVSTDEQKRKGYSLAEQEERLLQHCQINDIKIKGIFREDYSAKDFNRPEWKKLINSIKKNRRQQPENILFLKWDRFSRNIQYAYQMMGILGNLNAKAMAIDQPIDFDVPESIVMLAIYLSIPEAENHRRGLNTADGMRRAKRMGRWPGKAPIGYRNLTALDGKKFIAPKLPEADYINWSFQQLAKGRLTISQVWKMACARGFRCSKTNFWKLLRNPAYCGIVTIRPYKDEGLQFIRGVHQPLISKDLFHEVQSLLASKRKIVSKKEDLIVSFPLRGFLTCPLCQYSITGSFSQGKRLKYGYYHCTRPKCKGRFKVDVLNGSYEDELKKINLIPEIHELFNLVLEDENVYTNRRINIDERKAVLEEISTQRLLMSKARKFFLDEKMDFDDFGEFKKEHNEISGYLNAQLKTITQKLSDSCSATWPQENLNVFQSYKNQDIEAKRKVISLFTLSGINPSTKELEPLKINDALLLVINYSY